MALADAPTTTQWSADAADSTAESDPARDSSGDDSDSDTLDSRSARKRRKVSPPPEDDVPRISIASAPSRVKARLKNKQDLQDASSAIVLAPVDPQTTFAALDVKPWLVQSLTAMAIKRPTGIQKGCIPEILKGRDCIGGSRTGSGKTVAFAVPILQKWAEDPFGIFALILTPTRYAIVWAQGKRCS